jgi:hypothetical protein
VIIAYSKDTTEIPEKQYAAMECRSELLHSRKYLHNVYAAGGMVVLTAFSLSV